MARDNSSHKLSKKKVATKKTTKSKTIYPKVYQDKENNYISIKLKEGIETHSYLKKGILFLENEKGEVIEVQVMGE
jgi:hypothetical protein